MNTLSAALRKTDGGNFAPYFRAAKRRGEHRARVRTSRHNTHRLRSTTAAPGAAQQGEENTKWWAKRYYGRAYQHRMQLAWGSSVAILFCGMPLAIHLIGKEKRSQREKQKNTSTFIRNITTNPRTMTEREKIEASMLGIGGTREQMREIQEREKDIIDKTT